MGNAIAKKDAGNIADVGQLQLFWKIKEQAEKRIGKLSIVRQKYIRYVLDHPDKGHPQSTSRISRVSRQHELQFEKFLANPYQLVVFDDPSGNGYVAFYPELSGCLDHGKTVGEVMVNARQAKKDWFLQALERGDTIPNPKKN